MEDKRLENMIKNMEKIAYKDNNKIAEYSNQMIDYAVTNDKPDIVGRLANLGVDIPEYAKSLYDRFLADKEVEKRNVLNNLRNNN